MQLFIDTFVIIMWGGGRVKVGKFTWEDACFCAFVFKMYINKAQNMHVFMYFLHAISASFDPPLHHNGKGSITICSDMVVLVISLISQFVHVKSYSDLEPFIATDQLTKDFGGTLEYDHQDWVRFRMVGASLIPRP